MSGYKGYMLIITEMEKHRNTMKTDWKNYTKILTVIVLDSELQAGCFSSSFPQDFH